MSFLTDLQLDQGTKRAQQKPISLHEYPELLNKMKSSPLEV
jgi:hypothetical protein